MNFNHLLKQSLIWRGVYFITFFVLNIVVSRIFKANGSGEIFYLSSLFGFALLISGFGLDGGFTFFSSNKKIDEKKMATLAIMWTLFLALVVKLTISFSWNFINITSISDIDKSRYGFYYLTGILLVNYFVALFHSKVNYFLPSILLSILNVCLIFLLIWGFKNDISLDKLMYDFFVFNLIQGAILAMVFVVKYRVFESFNLPSLQELKQLIAFSMIGLFANIVFYIVYKLDYVFVKMWCNSNDLGNYIQASKLSQFLLVLPQIIASSIFPQTASGLQINEVIKSIIKLTKLFFVVFVLIFLGVLVMGKMVFIQIFGETFNNMKIPFIILLPGIFGLSISTLLSAYFSGKKKNIYNLYAAGIAISILAFGTFLFRNNYSIFIAATISCVAYLGEAIFCITKFLKLESLGIRDFADRFRSIR